MRNKTITISIIVGLTIGCITSRAQDYQRKALIEQTLNLESKSMDRIQKSDSVMNALYTAIKDSLEPTKINRRLDSFLLGSYTKKELSLFLKLDTFFKDRDDLVSIHKLPETIPDDQLLHFDTLEEISTFLNKSMHEQLKYSANVTMENQLKKLRAKLELTEKETQRLTYQYYVILGLKNALDKDSIPTLTVQRRLDSFLYGRYPKDFLLAVLKMDKDPNSNIEYATEFSNANGLPQTEKSKELRAHMKKIRETLENNIMVTTITDTIPKK